MKLSRSSPFHFLVTLGFLFTTLIAKAEHDPVPLDDKPLYHDHFPARRDLTIRKHDYRRTKHKEIVKWIDLRGGQYVLGMGIDEDSGKMVPFAVYDKTDPHPAYFRVWRNLFLGTIGINDLNLANLANKFSKMKKRKREKHAGEYVSNLIFQEDNHVFPNDWWKNPKLKWKEGKKPELAPARVPMSHFEVDIHENGYKKTVHDKVSELFYKFQTLGDDDESLSRDAKKLKDLTEHAEFVAQTDGTYRLVVNHTNHKLAPTKIIDIRGRFSSFKHSVAWGIMTQAAKQSTALLHNLFTVAPGLGYALLERFFNLIEITSLSRHAMALNMVMEALDNNPSSPFYGVLTEDELQDSIHYLRRSSMMLSDLIYFGVTSKWKVASKYLKNAEENRERSLEHLHKDGYKVHLFDNSYFALGIKRNEHDKIEQLKVFSLIKNKFYGHRPHDVVDFIHPNKERVKRNIQEAIMVGLSFLPLSFAVSPIRIIYKEIFLREMHRRIMAEAAFRAHLNHIRTDLIDALKKERFSDRRANEMVDIAYGMIYKREMNPMDIEHTNEQYYVHKVENWIKERDPDYQPIAMDTVGFDENGHSNLL